MDPPSVVYWSKLSQAWKQHNPNFQQKDISNQNPSTVLPHMSVITIGEASVHTVVSCEDMKEV